MIISSTEVYSKKKLVEVYIIVDNSKNHRRPMPYHRAL